MVEIIQRIKKWLIRWNASFQICPNSADIEKTKELAVKLRGNDDYETASNILKWQDKNIEYWYERADLYYILTITSGIILLLSLISYIFPNGIQINSNLLLNFTLFMFILCLLFIYVIITFVKNTTYCAFLIILFTICQVVNVKSHDTLSLSIVFLLGAFNGFSVFAFVKYRHFLLKTTGQTKNKEAFSLLGLTFETRIPFDKILHDKIVICIIIITLIFIIPLLSLKIPFTANLINVFLLGSIIGDYIFIYLKYLHFLRKITGETKYKEALKLLWLTFETRIPLEKILHYKMAMCIDYTKLTTAILIKLGIEPYVVKIKLHAASAVKINNEFYILDQHLPVEKYYQWCIKNKTENPNTYHVITSKNSMNKEIIRLEDVDFHENET